MNKKLLPVMAFLALGVGLVSNAMAKIGDLVTNEPSYANAEFMTEEETIVNVPVNIAFDEAEIEELTETTEADEQDVVANEPESTTAVTEAVAKEETSSAPEPVTTVAPEIVTPEPEPVYVEPNNIKIAGKELAIVDVADTEVDAGDHVNRYGLRFLYGHNSTEVFGDLKNVGEGATFSVTIDGVTRQYRVRKTVIFEKNMETGRLEINGESKYKGKDYMNALANAKFQGRQYDLSIMTCYGTPYANRDASHRYVIFADEI